jgi:ribulose 1,5-bisphosphate carboxylase large subunit-like protein
VLGAKGLPLSKLPGHNKRHEKQWITIDHIKTGVNMIKDDETISKSQQLSVISSHYSFIL